MKKIYSLSVVLMLSVITSFSWAQTLKLRYLFDDVTGNVVQDAAGDYDGTLLQGAAVRTIGGGVNTYNVLDLGAANGYLDMGAAIGGVMSGLTNYTISTYYWVDPSMSGYSGNGYMLWAFASVTNIGQYDGQGIYYALKGQGSTITDAGWSGGYFLYT